MVLSPGNVSKYEFLTCKYVFPEKALLEKAATIKRFDYSRLGSELERQTGIAKDHYKVLKDQKKVIENNRGDRDDKRKV